MTDDLDYHRLHWLLGKPAAAGRVKAEAADFQVREQLGFALDGEGGTCVKPAIIRPTSPRLGGERGCTERP